MNPLDSLPDEDHPIEMGDDGETPDVYLSHAEVMNLLEHGEIIKQHGIMSDSSNYTFLITLQHEEATLPAIYKPRRGERPLWDFPDGTLCLRERAAFLTSQVLGWDVVPPTVLREGFLGMGSMQFYVDHDPELHYFRLDDRFLPQLMRLCLFDVLVNNAERKGGHCIVDAGGHLWGIDHGITFNEEPKLRTVIWDFTGQPIPTELLDDVRQLCALLEQPSDYQTALEALLDKRERHAFRQRIHQVLQEGLFPLPSDRQNYPWPPI